MSMIPSFQIGYWLTSKQNYYITRSDFIKTMILNTIFCSLYQFNLTDKSEKEMESIIEDCYDVISKFDAFQSAQDMRNIVLDVFSRHFERKEVC